MTTLRNLHTNEKYNFVGKTYRSRNVKCKNNL